MTYNEVPVSTVWRLTAPVGDAANGRIFVRTSNVVASGGDTWGRLVLECNYVSSKTIIPKIRRMAGGQLRMVQCLVLIVPSGRKFELRSGSRCQV